jgi:hypothetical protein
LNICFVYYQHLKQAFQIFNIYWAGACAEQKEVGVPAESADPHALLHQQGGQQQWERCCLALKLQKSQHSPSGIVKVHQFPEKWCEAHILFSVFERWEDMSVYECYLIGNF